MLLLKVFGILLLVSASTGYGFYLASKIEKRVSALGEICTAINQLKERIRHNDGEINQLLKLTFNDCHAVKISNKKISFITAALNTEDEKILRDFFTDLGNQNIESEYSRCEMYLNLIKSRYETAQKEQKQKAKILRTTGICAGIAGAIFLI